MLQKGETVKIGEKEYRVETELKMPCIECDLKDCSHNKDFDELKAHHLALSCVDLMPIGTCFKEIEIVESSPQVDDKC